MTLWRIGSVRKWSPTAASAEAGSVVKKVSTATAQSSRTGDATRAELRTPDLPSGRSRLSAASRRRTLRPVANEGLLRTSDGATIWGAVEGSGPPILLCHGGPGLWDYLGDAAALLRADFTVHRWDQRGCGRSGPAPVYGFDVALRDVQDLRRAWGVDGRWGVMGHSWGASLALFTALLHPESTSALVYVSGMGTPSWWRDVGSARSRAEQSRRLSDAERERLTHLDGLDRTAAEEVEFRRLSWVTDFAHRDPAPVALEEMVTSPLPISREINRALARASPLDDEQLVAACERCDVPSLFVHGSEDPRPAEGPRLLAAHLPNAAFVTIEGAGHHPWFERPVEFATAVRGFLRAVG